MIAGSSGRWETKSARDHEGPTGQRGSRRRERLSSRGPSARLRLPLLSRIGDRPDQAARTGASRCPAPRWRCRGAYRATARRRDARRSRRAPRIPRTPRRGCRDSVLPVRCPILACRCAVGSPCGRSTRWMYRYSSTDRAPASASASASDGLPAPAHLFARRHGQANPLRGSAPPADGPADPRVRVVESRRDLDEVQYCVLDPGARREHGRVSGPHDRVRPVD